MQTTVTMLEKRFAYFPKLFQCNGKSYAVREVVRCWTSRDTLTFRVKTEQGTFDLIQNVKTNKWTLSEVKP